MRTSPRRNASLFVSLVAAGALAVGCGSAKDSQFGDGSGAGEGQLASGEGFAGGSGAQPVSGASGGPGGAGAVGNVDPNSACASSNAGAALEPVSLVFMIDRSGSMVEVDDDDVSALRWNPVVSGLTSFFGDAASANVSASLAFFPKNEITVSNRSCQRNRDCRSGESCSNNVCIDVEMACDASAYAQQVVPMTQLPSATPFASAFTATRPSGGTPTAPALSGAIAAAKAVKDAGKNVAVVLATDGQPNNCSSSVSAVEAAAAAGLADGIRTYVIGVGPSTGNLNSFASNGGTTSAIMIPTNDAAQVSADLIKAVNQIANSLLGCTYGLPAPPSGQTLDVNAVNVNFTPAGAASKTLPYSADCANADGWHYDDAKAPTQVVLCGGSCAAAQAAVGAKLDIIFGCATAVPSGGVDPSGNVR